MPRLWGGPQQLRTRALCIAGVLVAGVALGLAVGVPLVLPLPWLQQGIEKSKRISATGTLTVDLPTSHPIGGVGWRARLGGTTPTYTLNRVRIVANGSAVLWDTEGGQARAISKFEAGAAPLGTVNSVYEQYLQAGRTFHDEEIMWPAGFSSLQLQLDITLGGTSPTADHDVWADLLIGGKPKYSRRVVNIGGKVTVVASDLIRQKIPLGGGMLRAVYIHTDDTDNVDGADIRLLVNGGSEVPFSMDYKSLMLSNIMTYRFNDADVPDEAELSNREAGGTATTDGEKLVKLDLDVLEDLRQARSLAGGSGISDLQIEVKADGSGVSGDVAFIVEEIFPLG